MDHANKDEGLKCLNIAQRALDAGDVDKALRFAEKSARLYPSETASAVLDRVQRAAAAGGSTSTATDGNANGTANGNSTASSNGPVPSGMGDAGLRQRGIPRPAAAPQPRARPAQSQDTDAQATPEQRSLVASIRSKTSYYEILAVSRTANDDEIKRSCRKLALKLHPDKNKARGADEAFKGATRQCCVLRPLFSL